MSSTLDLNAPPPNHKFSVTVEREETPGEQGVRLFKDLSLYLLAVAAVTLIGWYAFATLRSPAASGEEKKWAMSVLSAAAGGLIGYLVRK